MPGTGPVLVAESRGPIRVLKLNRPARRNALSAELIALLCEALAEADRDESVRAIVITGAGEKAFCAGADLASVMSGGEADGASAHASRRSYAQLLLALESLGKPSIAQANGAVLAGGLGLLCACDFALAADDIQLGTPEVDVGIFPYMALAPILRCVGRRAAIELAFTGKRITAAEGQAMGLITRSVPRGMLSAEVEKLALTLASKSPVSMRLGRRAFQIAESMPYAQALEALAGQLSLNALAEDAMEGISAFIEKRKPEFKGR